jgi:hypothetical protein
VHKLILDIPYQDQVSDILDFILTLKYINIVTSYFPPRLSSRLDSKPSTCIFCMYISNANHCLISGLVVKVDHTSSTTDTGSGPDTHSKMVWFPETHLKCFTLQTLCVCVQHTHVHMSGFVKVKMVHLSYVRISCMVAMLYGCVIRYDISIVE